MGTEEAITEVAKAARAHAPAINEPIKAVTDGLRWFGGTFGRPLGIAVGMLEDWVYQRRCEARFKVIEKTREKLSNTEIPQGSVPDGFLVPLLEACGDAQSDELQYLWAELLANAVAREEARNPAFI